MCSLRAQLPRQTQTNLRTNELRPRDGQLSKSAATVDHMAACPDCHREMRLASSCVTTLVVTVGDKRFDRVRHSADALEPCEDCGVKQGGVHHFGCDMELCPSCGGQLIMCAG